MRIVQVDSTVGYPFLCFHLDLHASSIAYASVPSAGICLIHPRAGHILVPVGAALGAQFSRCCMRRMLSDFRCSRLRHARRGTVGWRSREEQEGVNQATRRHGNLSAEQCPAGLAPTERLLTSASAASS